MTKKTRIKKWLSQSENIALSSLIIATFSLVIAITFPVIQNCIEINRKQGLIHGENVYNIGLVNTYKTAFKDNELDKKLFFNKFSVDIYKNNWDIIFNLEPNCTDNLIRAIAIMDAIDSINESILTLYNQEGLVFATNQWENTKERTAQWRIILIENLNKLDAYFDDLSQCQF